MSDQKEFAKSARRKFLFLYLTTGAGHISTARVLKEQIQKQNPDAEIIMVNGFDRKNFFGKAMFEHGYFIATNALRGAFSLIYDITMYRFAQTFFSALLRSHTTRYLKKVIERENPTDIVSFHFALSTFAKSAILRSGKKINLTVMVTDPFTTPNAWFWDRRLDYFVYSEDAKRFALAQKIPEKQITIVPFVLNEKYTVPFDKNDIAALRKKHGFAQDKKVVLMVGGGDGIPGAVEIINKCVVRRAKFAIAIVCGKDLAKKNLPRRFFKNLPEVGFARFRLREFFGRTGKTFGLRRDEGGSCHAARSAFVQKACHNFALHPQSGTWQYAFCRAQQSGLFYPKAGRDLRQNRRAFGRRKF